jgi:DNA-directed RNA polymerase specialized sigma24 family protein
MGQPSDDELLVAIATGPGAFPEFYRRHVARVTAMGVRRFDSPEDVADFVATVFLEVLGSAGGFDPGRGPAVAWLYGVGGNVAIAMYRQRWRAVQAEQRISGRALLDPDDYARVEESIVPPPGCARPTWPCGICLSRTAGCWNWSRWTA